MIIYILTIVACIIAIIAYVIYYFKIKKSGIIPNRLAWLICSVSVSLETLTYCFVSEDYSKSLYFIISSLCCILITVKIWKFSSWNGASRAQKYSLVIYSLSLAIWSLFQLPFIAHLLLVIIIPVTFYPIYISAYKNYKNENSLPWLLWSVSDLIVIISIGLNMKTVQELPYAIVQFICPFTVYAIIQFQRFRNSKSSYVGKFHWGKWRHIKLPETKPVFQQNSTTGYING